MSEPYPTEFGDDVVRVAKGSESGVTIEQIARDFGVHPMTLQKWLRRADIDEGAKPGATRPDAAHSCWATTWEAPACLTLPLIAPT